MKVEFYITSQMSLHQGTYRSKNALKPKNYASPDLVLCDDQLVVGKWEGIFAVHTTMHRPRLGCKPSSWYHTKIEIGGEH